MHSKYLARLPAVRSKDSPLFSFPSSLLSISISRLKNEILALLVEKDVPVDIDFSNLDGQG
jgi:hypothetical protein